MNRSRSDRVRGRVTTMNVAAEPPVEASKSRVDPRLDHEQAIEWAMQIAGYGRGGP
jgi:hypothetical protein